MIESVLEEPKFKHYEQGGSDVVKPLTVSRELDLIKKLASIIYSEPAQKLFVRLIYTNNNAWRIEITDEVVRAVQNIFRTSNTYSTCEEAISGFKSSMMNDLLDRKRKIQEDMQKNAAVFSVKMEALDLLLSEVGK